MLDSIITHDGLTSLTCEQVSKACHAPQLRTLDRLIANLRLVCHLIACSLMFAPWCDIAPFTWQQHLSVSVHRLGGVVMENCRGREF
jgi:hypothetical protein